MGMGEKRHKTELYVDKIEDVKVPNWVTKYNLFRSTQGNTSPDAIRKEYVQTLNEWLQKNPDGTSDAFRKEVGIIIDEKGRELLTNDFKSEKLRALRERQQRPRGSKVKGAGDEWQPTKKPFFAEFEKLEGHHKRGLANLGVFFDGATPEQAFEMRQRMLNEDFVGGTDKRNWAWLNKKQHHLAHKILGSAQDAEIDNPKYKGIEFFDLEKPGQKGVPGFSDKFRDYVKGVPFDRPKVPWGGANQAWTGPIDKDMINRGDLLMEYLRTTDEGFDKSITQAKQLEPSVLTKNQLAPGFTETTGKQFISPAGKKITQNPNFSKNAQAGLDMSDELQNIGRMGKLSKYTKMASNLDRAGALTMMATNPWAGTLGLAMTTPLFQRKMAGALAKFGARMVPGVSFGTGALASAGYMMNGQWTKAGIQLLAGAIGEIPGGAGDVAQSAIELGLEGHDLYKTKTNKPKVDPNIDPNVKQSRFGKGTVNTRRWNPAKVFQSVA